MWPARVLGALQEPGSHKPQGAELGEGGMGGGREEGGREKRREERREERERRGGEGGREGRKKKGKRKEEEKNQRAMTSLCKIEFYKLELFLTLIFKI